MTTNSEFQGYAELVRARLLESMAVKERLSLQATEIARAADILVQAYKSGGRLFLFGNGGSAADAQHIAAELVGRYYLDRPSLPAEALTVNSSSVTAIGNDFRYELVFSRQLEGLSRRGDVALGISTSGNSENVLRGIQTARSKGLHTIGLTGEGGGKLRGLVDCCVCVPSQEVPRIQESHILVGHILCEIIEAELFG
jgi:D-sedoheptulose 7-phosphate isomerase